MDEALNELREQNKTLLSNFKKMENYMQSQEKKMDALEAALVESNNLKTELNKLAADNLSMKNKVKILEEELEFMKMRKKQEESGIGGISVGAK